MDRPGKPPPGNDEASTRVRPGARLVQVLSALFGGSSVVAFGVFLFTGSWALVPLVSNMAAVLVFDTCLSLAFFAQHSGMIRRRFKAWFARLAPEPYHGAVYSITAGIILYGVIVFWQQSEPALVSAEGYVRAGMRACFLAALAGIAWSNLALRSFDVFGLRAIDCHLGGIPQPVVQLSERGPYRWVRHPQYFLILVMIWSQPELTADRLLFNLLWSAWVVAGTLLEERDLAVAHGERYREYQSRVPMLIPWRLPRRSATPR